MLSWPHVDQPGLNVTWTDGHAAWVATPVAFRHAMEGLPIGGPRQISHEFTRLFREFLDTGDLAPLADRYPY